MRLISGPATALALMVALGASAAQSATLVHAYEFSNTGGATAVDLIGGANGTLTGDAAIAGGVLSLDGDGDAVTFGSQLIAFGGDFSVFVRAQLKAPVSGHTEIIAQGASGGPGFYIGSEGNTYRLTDAYPAPGLAFHVDDLFHNLLLTNSAVGGFRFSIDGSQVFAGNRVGFGGSCNTVIGNQFCGAYSEYFKGAVDTVRIYAGTATYAEATTPLGAVPEPATWGLLIAGFGLTGAMLRHRRRPAIA